MRVDHYTSTLPVTHLPPQSADTCNMYQGTNLDTVYKVAATSDTCTCYHTCVKDPYWCVKA